MQNLKDVRADMARQVKGLVIFLNLLDDFELKKQPDGSVSLTARLGAKKLDITATKLLGLMLPLGTFLGEQPLYKWDHKQEEIGLMQLLADD